MSADRNYDAELIQKSLFGNLTNEERIDFERNSVHDSFQKEIKFQKEMLSIIHNEEHERLKKVLREEEKKIVSESTGISKGRIFKLISWKTTVAAATVAILIGAFYLLQPKSQSEKLYAQYFNIYPNLIEVTSRGSDVTTDRQEVFNLYDAGDHMGAIDLYQESNSLKGDPDISFYIALSMMTTGDFDTAKLILDQLATNINHNFLPQIKWYLALIHIRYGDQSTAQKLLSDIAEDPGHYKNEEAREILDLIDK